MNPHSRAVQPLFLEAIALLRQGQFETAEAAFLRLLKRDPRNGDACHLAGFAVAQLGRLEDAVKLLSRAVTLNPRNAMAQFDLGKTLVQLDRDEEALVSLERAVVLVPESAEAHYFQGLALLKQKRADDALIAFERAVSLQPDFALAHNDLGCAMNMAGRFPQALAAFQKALSLEPESPFYLMNTARALCARKRYAEALPMTNKVLQRKPNDEAALVLRAEALIGLGHGQEALSILETILARDPHHEGALNWRCAALLQMGQYEKALSAAEEAKAILPHDAVTRYYLGFSLAHLNRCDEALACYEEALKLEPDNTAAALVRALTLLTMGRFAEGWAAYEDRVRCPDAFIKRDYPKPLWLGQETLKDKRLFVYWEQGFGDTLQFARYVLLAAAAGAKVAFSVQDPLRRLFGGWSPLITVIGQNEEPTDFDLHCPLLSMPLGFATRVETIPSLPENYLKVSAGEVAAWQEKLPEKRRRIGVTWSGRPTHPNDANRSLPLIRLQGLLNPDDTWISLQKEVRETDRPALEALGLLDPSPAIHDFADTAALISTLDLVITVDTSVAHLAGALGKPCWVMLPFAPDFRWLLDREDSPWYPSIRLFRQQRPGDWDGVVARLNAALAADMLQ
jgi:tetratricopeptide (TPR) repeat protein